MLDVDMCEIELLCNGYEWLQDILLIGFEYIYAVYENIEVIVALLPTYYIR